MASADDATLPTYSERPQAPVFEKKRYRRRYVTRIAATAISIIAIAVLIPSMVVHADTYYDYGYYDDGKTTGWISPEGYIFLGVSIIWNTAQFIVLARRRRANGVRGAGIHPGAHVGVDLILWMGLLGAGLTKALIDLYWPLGIAAGVMMIISAILHFTLFVWACIDTERLRVSREARRITAIAMELQSGQRGAQFEVPEGMALVPIETLARLKDNGVMSV